MADKEIKKEVEAAAKTAKAKAESSAKPAKKAAASAKKTVKKEASNVTKAVKKEAAKTKAAATKLGKQALEILTPDKTTVYVQYLGREFDTNELLAQVKEAYIAAGSPAGAVKTISLYVKPEDNAAYYVINDTETGAISL